MCLDLVEILAKPTLETRLYDRSETDEEVAVLSLTERFKTDAVQAPDPFERHIRVTEDVHAEVAALER